MSAPTSTIRTAEELAALPVGTVLRDGAGVVWLKFSGVMTEWRSTHGGIAPSEFVARKRWPLTVLHRPDLPTQADLHAAVERVRAVVDEWASTDPDAPNHDLWRAVAALDTGEAP